MRKLKEFFIEVCDRAVIKCMVKVTNYFIKKGVIDEFELGGSTLQNVVLVESEYIGDGEWQLCWFCNIDGRRMLEYWDDYTFIEISRNFKLMMDEIKNRKDGA